MFFTGGKREVKQIRQLFGQVIKHINESCLCKVKTSYFCKPPCIFEYCKVISADKGTDNILFVRETRHDYLTPEQSNSHKRLFHQKTRKERADDQTNIKETHFIPLLLNVTIELETYFHFSNSKRYGHSFTVGFIFILCNFSLTIYSGP